MGKKNKVVPAPAGPSPTAEDLMAGLQKLREQAEQIVDHELIKRDLKVAHEFLGGKKRYEEAHSVAGLLKNYMVAPEAHLYAVDEFLLQEEIFAVTHQDPKRVHNALEGVYASCRGDKLITKMFKRAEARATRRESQLNRADQLTILQELKGLDASLAEGVAGVRESVRSAVEGGQVEGEGVGASEVGLPGMVPPSGGYRTRG